MSIDDFARISLMFGPSPVHRLERLSAHLGGKVEIWAKREDCNSGIAFGGNKVRKLEYLVADALAKGCDTLVSIGGIQSNHTRQDAASPAPWPRVVPVQEHWVDWDDPGYEVVGNIHLSRIMGGDVRLVRGFRHRLPPSWQQAVAESRSAAARHTRSRPAHPTIRSAATASPTGCTRWRNRSGARRLLRHDRVCSVTGSTQAGMIAGSAGRSASARMLGIDGTKTCSRPGSDRAHRAPDGQSIGVGRELRSRRVRVGGRHAGPTAFPTSRRSRRSGARGRRACSPTRSTRAIDGGLIDLVRDGRIEPGARVLYAHLGGQPALNAYSSAF